MGLIQAIRNTIADDIRPTELKIFDVKCNRIVFGHFSCISQLLPMCYLSSVRAYCMPRCACTELKIF